MTSIEPVKPDVSTLVGKATAILLSPTESWRRIALEPASVGRLYAGYIVPMAGAAVIARLIGVLAFGHPMYHEADRPPILRPVAIALTDFGMTLLGVAVLAWLINGLAHSFGGRRDRVSAYKLAAYAGTAGWVAGLLMLYPPLMLLALLGSFYGIYLLYTGAPVLMKTDARMRVGYTAAIVLVAVVLKAITALALMDVGESAERWSGGEAIRAAQAVRLPNGEAFNLGAFSLADFSRIHAASDAVKRLGAGMKMDDGDSAAADQTLAAPTPEAMKALLPAQLPGGFDRGEITLDKAKWAGVTGSCTHATYAKGDVRVAVKIIDLADAGPLAALGAGLNIKADKKTATGYKKIGKVDGRLTAEEFDGAAKRGQYAVLVADRFVVETSGTDVDMDQLRAAAGAVGFGRLEALAKGA